MEAVVAQQLVSRRYAALHDLIVVDNYLDVSSSDSWQRPGLSRLMAKAQVGAFEVVLVEKPVRLFSRMAERQAFVARMQTEYDIEVVFVQQGGAA